MLKAEKMDFLKSELFTVDFIDIKYCKFFNQQVIAMTCNKFIKMQTTHCYWGFFYKKKSVWFQMLVVIESPSICHIGSDILLNFIT